MSHRPRLHVALLCAALAAGPCARVLAGSVASAPGPIQAPVPARSVTIDDKLIDDEGIRKRIEREFGGRGRTVRVEGAMDRVHIVGDDGDRVRLTAELEFWSNDTEWMDAVRKKFDVRVAESDSAIVFSAEIPLKERRGVIQRFLRKDNIVHYSVVLELTVPRGTPIEVDNRYGDVTVAQVRGPARISNNSGAIEIDGARGDVRLTGRYGDIRVLDVEGELSAETTSGALEARRIIGMTTLSSQYGNIEVEAVEGRLEASASSGGVKASDIGGDARLSSSYANVDARGIRGRLRVETQSGQISVRDVERDAELSTSYGEVEVQSVGGNLVVKASSSGARVSDVAGSLRLEGSYGDVVVERVGGPAEITAASGGVTVAEVKGDLSVGSSYGTVRVKSVEGALRVSASSSGVEVAQVSGPVTVETSYAGVNLSRIGGAVTVRNQSGAVSVRELYGRALQGEHSVETTYADIEFGWPEGRALAFRLESTYGEIDSYLPGQERKSGSRRVLEGSSDELHARVNLLSLNGSIRLRRD